jgi:hypothetical protein
MVNHKGAPRKYPGKVWDSASIFLPDPFKPTWKDFTALAEIDNDPEFLQYVEFVEKENLANRRAGRRALYHRWIIARHVLENIHKLHPEAPSEVQA